MNRRHLGAAVVALCALGCESSPPQPTRDATQSAAKSAAKPAPSGTGATPAAKKEPDAASQAKGPFTESTHEAMLDPSKATEKAPDSFKAKLETTAGDFVLECTRAWAPNGVDRFYNLVKIGYYDDVALFRVAPGFVVQWGIHGNPKVSEAWMKANIEPDTVTESNKKGTVTFAQAGGPAAKGKTATSRSTQVFINYADNDNLDEMGFAPICKVVDGFDDTTKFGGSKHHQQLTSAQGQIFAKGNAFLRSAYPELDYIKKATIVGDEPKDEDGDKKGAGKGEGKGTGDGSGKGTGDGSGKGEGKGTGDGKGKGSGSD
jgi:peptidyl-prolyl cis-trans isomerase A (cyclophilin A)